MNKPLVMGIDPGVSLKSPGALALVHAASQKLILAWFLPMGRDRKGRAVLDEANMMQILDIWASQIALAVIEDPNSHGHEGRASLWRFAQVCAQLPTITRCAGVPVQLVKPSSWKAAMGLTKDKKTSLAWARKQFPESTAFTRVKDHGKAEAAALAILGIRQFLPMLRLTQGGN